MAIVVLFGLALRLYLSWEWNSTHPNSVQRLRADEPGYFSLAQGLLEGHGLTWPGRVPLYPLWLAGIFALPGGSFNVVTYAQSFVGATVILLTYLLGRRVFDHRVGLLAALMASCSYILIHQSLRLLSEILYTPATVLVAITLWNALQRPSWRRFVIAGVWIGVSNLIRPTLFLFPFFLAVTLLVMFGWRRGLRYSTALVLTAMLVVLPWMTRNYLRYDAIYPLATSNAFLWQGSPEYYRLIHDEGYTYLDIWNKVIYGPGGEGHDPGSVEGDRYWTQRALRSIASDPVLYARFVAEKLVTYWIGDPNADWGDTHVFNYRALRGFGFSRAVTLQYMIARGLAIVALVAIVIVRHRWRTLLPIYLLLGYNMLLHGIGHAEARLSEPLQPLLLILIAGTGVTLLGQFSRSWRWTLPRARLTVRTG